MSHTFHRRHCAPRICFFAAVCLMLCLLTQPCTAKAGTFSFLFLNHYALEMNIGDSCYLVAFTYDGSTPTFKSSKSSVASVNCYGKITAKSAGNTTITVKTKNAEASCDITVRPTRIALNQSSVRLERNGTFRLEAITSNDSTVTFKTNKKSVATVNESGLITAHKPGEATITATADKSSVTCRVIVKKPTITLSQTRIQLYRCGRRRLQASVSSGVRPVWKSSRSSVVTVDQYGVIAARKHGTADITATVDGVSKTCRVTVKSPTITLDRTSIKLKVGQKTQLKATVSSHNKPTYRVSNSNVILVDNKGMITAWKKGTSYVTVSEDGASARCKVTVTER